jgi:hypothetical protein
MLLKFWLLIGLSRSINPLPRIINLKPRGGGGGGESSGDGEGEILENVIFI